MRLAAVASAEEQSANAEDRAYVRDEHPERLDLLRLTFQENSVLKASLGALPVAVISRAALSTFEVAEQVKPGITETQWQTRKQIWAELQADYATTSTLARHIQAKLSGHYVHFDGPNLVIEEIYRVWEMVWKVVT